MKAQKQRMKLRKTRVTYIGLAAFVIMFALCATFVKKHSEIFIGASQNPLYTPQLSRNAEWDGPINKVAYTDDQIRKIAQNSSYEIIPKFSEQYNIQAHFADARKIISVANGYGNPIKVFDYFSGRFWFDVNNEGWKPYSDSFNKGDPNDLIKNPGWFMTDSKGSPVPFYGTGGTPGTATRTGYMIDDSNPTYRAWAVATIKDWMKQAPYKGIAFDSSNALVGTDVWEAVGDGSQTWNDLLCGPNAPVDGNGNCARVAQWNAGLTSLISEARAALSPMGAEVLYNGVAPSNARGATRNVGLLASADIAANESFCFGAAAVNNQALVFRSLTDDITMMQQQAANGKKIFEITNYQVTEKVQYGPYCLGGFLMGWQPGYDYWMFHRNYSDPLSGQYPLVAEQNLNLGNPTEQYKATGSVLSRTFQNGYVVVNNSDASANYTLPAKLVQFSDGKQGSTYTAGSQLSLSARSGAFFLSDTYVNPVNSNSVDSSTSGSSNNSGGNASDKGNSDKSSDTLLSQIKTTDSKNGTVSGDISLITPAIDGVTKVEYYIDGKLIRTVTKFPDSGQIDTKQLSNGKHALLTKYYHSDGSVTTAIKNIVVHNPGVGEKISNVAKLAVLPTAGVMALLAIMFFVFHRFQFLIPRWFYHRKSSPNDAVQPASSSPAVSTYHPGIVIAPRVPSSDDRNKSEH